MPGRQPEIEKLRAEIDRIDEAMHRLLMERGELIAAVQAAKGVGGEGGTSAMRPAREARMLRALARRHSGAMPLVSVERIWREIIGSFTQLQAPFRVLMTGAEPAVLQEYARHYFSVTTPLAIGADVAEVIGAIARDGSVVGAILGDEEAAGGGTAPWWAVLAEDQGNPARIVAKLPFFHSPGSDDIAQRPAILLSRSPVEPSGDDVTLAVVRAELDSAAAAERHVRDFLTEIGAGEHGVRVVAEHGGGPAAYLAEIGGHVAARQFEAGEEYGIRWIGGYPAPLET